MRKACIRGAALAIFLTLVATVSLADKTMDRIKATGVVRVGFQDDAVPFAYLDPRTGKHIGFSVDMAYLLAENLSKRFGRKVEIQPVTVMTETRIPFILEGKIDVEMGSSTYTVERDREIDFSICFFVSETAFLVNEYSGIKALDNLNTKVLGVTAGTTNLAVLEELVKIGRLRPKKLVVVKDHRDGLRALKKGDIDAYASDRILLEVRRLQGKDSDQWITTDFAVSYEPYAYMVRENCPVFREFLDNTIRWSLWSGKFYEIYDRWMGPYGICPFKLPPAFKEYLNIMTVPMKSDWWKE